MPDETVERWLESLLDRHTRNLTRPEFLKAVRALSARYVERRAELPARSPLDSAGKRAAFAAFYAPLHFVTTQAIVRALGARTGAGGTIVDYGCGTGAASAAWALAFDDAPAAIVGLDRSGWAIGEAAWNWRMLGISGQARRANLVDALERAITRAGRATAVLLAGSANELDNESRARVLRALVDGGRSAGGTLIIEPLARSAVPWWDAWASAFARAGGRADEWKLDVALPPRLADISDAVGFRRQGISARTLWRPGGV